jgi:hypothetical protein
MSEDTEIRQALADLAARIEQVNDRVTKLFEAEEFLRRVAGEPAKDASFREPRPRHLHLVKDK